jgi:hypothetical protein
MTTIQTGQEEEKVMTVGGVAIKVRHEATTLTSEDETLYRKED